MVGELLDLAAERYAWAMRVRRNHSRRMVEQQLAWSRSAAAAMIDAARKSEAYREASGLAVDPESQSVLIVESYLEWPGRWNSRVEYSYRFIAGYERAGETVVLENVSGEGGAVRRHMVDGRPTDLLQDIEEGAWRLTLAPHVHLEIRGGDVTFVHWYSGGVYRAAAARNVMWYAPPFPRSKMRRRDLLEHYWFYHDVAQGMAEMWGGGGDGERW